MNDTVQIRKSTLKNAGIVAFLIILAVASASAVFYYKGIRDKQAVELNSKISQLNSQFRETQRDVTSLNSQIQDLQDISKNRIRI